MTTPAITITPNAAKTTYNFNINNKNGSLPSVKNNPPAKN